MMSSSEREAHEGILAVALEFKVANTHQPALNRVLDAFEVRLAEAGFFSLNEPEQATYVNPEQDCYKVWARRKWTHPECERAFCVELCLGAILKGELQGEVAVELLLSDQECSEGRPGVLGNETFCERVVLQQPFAFGNGRFWKSWVSHGVTQLVPKTFVGLFDRMQAYLEAATTP